MKKFVAIRKPGKPRFQFEDPDKTVFEFDTAHELCVWLWGKSPSHYEVFLRQDDIGGSIDHMAAVLTDRALESSLDI